MSKPILLSAAQLNDCLKAGDCIVVDCRFDLADTGKGRSQWLAGHIPGARYAHLDDDLSSPILPDTGRHPLPETAAFARYLASIGWRPELLLVAYDEGASAIAARLWWLMRYHGLQAALLDGGLAAWRAAALLRLALVYHLRPPYARLGPGLVERAQTWLREVRRGAR